MVQAKQQYEPPAGRSIRDFARDVGLCVATLYNLVPECVPRTARIGARVIVVESPHDWLCRMAAMGGARTRRWPSSKAPSGKGAARTRKSA